MSGVIAQQHQRTPGRLERMTQLPERLRLQAHQSDTETFRIPFTEREVRFPSLFLSRDVPDRQQKDRRMRTVAALAVGGAFVATAGTWGLGAAVVGGAVAGVKLGRRIAGHYEAKKACKWKHDQSEMRGAQNCEGTRRIPLQSLAWSNAWVLRFKIGCRKRLTTP